MFELTEQELKDLGDIFIDLYKKKLAEEIYPFGNPTRGKGNKIATGRLRNSLQAKVITTGDGLMLQLSYLDYFKYVNLGRRAGKKPPPVKVLLQWIKDRKLKGRNKKGRFIKDLSFAFAIQTNIRKFGIRRTNIFDKSIDSLEDAFLNPPREVQEQYNRLYEAIGEDVGNFINKLYEDEIATIR